MSYGIARWRDRLNVDLCYRIFQLWSPLLFGALGWVGSSWSAISKPLAELPLELLT